MTRRILTALTAACVGVGMAFAEEKGPAGAKEEAAKGEKEIKAVEGIPAALKGFQGMMSGTLVKKGDSSLVFKVEKILKTWEGNKAKEPQAAVGLTITLSLSSITAHSREKLMGNYRAMKQGDSIELEAFDVGGGVLVIKEWLKKTGAKKE